MTDLHSVGGDLAGAIEAIGVPSHVVDPRGIVRWQNDASRRIIGDVCGRSYTSVITPEDAQRARDRFARVLLGGSVPDDQLTVFDANGDRVKVEVSSVPLRDGHHLVGVFGQAPDVERMKDGPPHPLLTPRQSEVLRLLERGRSTQQIADELHLSPETVRNHIRHIFSALGVHSRIEAVAVSRGRDTAG